MERGVGGLAPVLPKEEGGLCGHHGKISLEVTGLVISAIYRLLVMKDIRMRERTERVDKRKQTVQLVRRRRRMSLSP